MLKFRRKLISISIRQLRQRIKHLPSLHLQPANKTSHFRANNSSNWKCWEIEWFNNLERIIAALDNSEKRWNREICHRALLFLGVTHNTNTNHLARVGEPVSKTHLLPINKVQRDLENNYKIQYYKPQNSWRATKTKNLYLIPSLKLFKKTQD